MSVHYSEDDLTLYYYGEGRRPGAIERHLQECAACAAVYREITGTLAMIVADEVPERGDQYGLEVWQRIRHRLVEEEESALARFARFVGFGGFGLSRRAIVVGGAVALIVIAFVAGRTSRPTSLSSPATVATNVNPSNPAKPSSAADPSNPANPSTRVLLTSVADHLDRSERVLTEIMNASGPRDISAEQRWAEDLLTTSRLYRQDATDAGEQSVASVLDELERNLLEIVHSPAKISAADLEQLRRRIDAAALLFKVRVTGDELRRRESAPADQSSPRTPTTLSSSKVG